MMKSDRVEEIQGLYGPVSVTERLVQQIWLKQDFHFTDLRSEEGSQITVQDPGRWNVNEGPDFLGARIHINGEEFAGDVEIHFYVQDWDIHQHGLNPNFNRVILHVVLFPLDGKKSSVRTSNGHAPETLVLMPLLDRDLESHAMESALLELESQDIAEWVTDFCFRPLYERISIVESAATARWKQKLEFAKKRLKDSTWAEVCHQSVLEVLGYSRNRTPMSRMALRYPLKEFKALSVDRLFAEEEAAWRLNGLRPANHPRKRLEQYTMILDERPDWPDQLLKWASKLPMIQSPVNTKSFRREVGMQSLLDELGETVFAGALSSSRLNTICVDALFPLLVAKGGVNVSNYWMHWFSGDMPEALRKFLKFSDLVDREYPYANGRLQGALSLTLSRGPGNEDVKT